MLVSPSSQLQEVSKLRVLAWPLESRFNAYVANFHTALSSHAVVENFSPGLRLARRALKERFDTVHVHWLERPFWAAGSRKRPLKIAAYALLVLRLLRLRGTRLVWIVHDPTPHNMASNLFLQDRLLRAAWRIYVRKLLGMVDGLIFLSEVHRAEVAEHYPRLAGLPWLIAPHPHYRGAYSDETTREAARDALAIDPEAPVLAFVGNMRRYKNPDGLARAFTSSPVAGTLLLAGKPDSEAYEVELQELAGADVRIKTSFDFLPDDHIQLYLRACDAAIFPYRDVTNSGSALLALSFDRPVVVPDLPIFRELRDAVGEEWVYLYQGELEGSLIEDIMTWARRPRGVPNLYAFDPATIALSTAHFFQTLARRRILHEKSCNY